MSTLRIICWGHRRAIAPLRAACDGFRGLRPNVEIVVDVRPLSDFEHQGIAEVAAHYDIVIFDHPFCGDIASGGHFLPLDVALPTLLGTDADALYVGPSLESYRYAGHVWGAPIDAATQNAVYRADLLSASNEPVPECWSDVVALGHRLMPLGLKLGIAIETPHALATIASLMANFGKAWRSDSATRIELDRAAFLKAYQMLQELLSFCPPDVLGWNSIDVHEAMVSRDDIAYCPAAYGYATYAETDQRRRLSFASFPGTTAPFGAGSMIGGTALGVSSLSSVADAAIAFVGYMLEPEVQDQTIPGHHGQAARLSSWLNEANDLRFNGFFSATLPSIEAAWIRPRGPGFPVFQREAGYIVAEALKSGADGEEAVDAVLLLADQVVRISAGDTQTGRS